MPPKKRPYVPKVKGCYECSQRRIHCDRGQPECQKCISKGVKCSGLGIRHRFNKGVASRGKWAGKVMENIYKEEGRIRFDTEDTVEEARASRPQFENILPKPVQQPPNIHEIAPNPHQESFKETSVATMEKDLGLEGLEVPEISESSDSSESPESQTFEFVEDVEWIGGGTDTSALSCVNAGTNSLFTLFQPMLDHIPRWKRNLLLHFSDRIANEMVAIDGLHNGYRYLILPFCEMDDLVMDAVITVSAFHLNLGGSPSDVRIQQLLQDMPKSSRIGNSRLPDPNQLYAQTILGLQRRRELGNCDQLSKQSILLTILVLLTGAMVTGGPDFPMLFRMLESAFNAIGCETGLGEGDLTTFLVPQIHKMRVYSAPLISEDSGREILSSETHALQLFQCLGGWLQQYPDHIIEVSFVMDLIQQALDIYLGQVLMRSTSSPASTPTIDEITDSINRVQRFKETWEAFPHNAQGEQVLVWASFVAASDCLLDEHREFFENVFMKHHARSGFGNVVRGLEYLRKIWARSPGERWTSLLPQAKILVM